VIPLPDCLILNKSRLLSLGLGGLIGQPKFKIGKWIEMGGREEKMRK